MLRGISIEGRNFEGFFLSLIFLKLWILIEGHET